MYCTLYCTVKSTVYSTLHCIMYCTACSTVFSVEYSVQSSTNLAVTETHEDWRLRTQISAATKHKNLFLPLFTHLNPVMPFQFYFTYKMSVKRAQRIERKKCRFTTRSMFRAKNLPKPWQFYTSMLVALVTFCMSWRKRVPLMPSSSDLTVKSASLHDPIIFNLPFIFICS